MYSTDSCAEVKHTSEEDKFNVELLQGGSIRNLYSRRLEDALNEEFEGSSEEMYGYIKNTIKKIAHEALSVKSMKNYEQTG
jgi:hypothetical protein